MSTQPKPLQLADECMESANCWANEIDTRLKAADELRRLYAVNQELLKALKIADAFCGSLTSDDCPDSVHIPIREAIEKVEAV